MPVTQTHTADGPEWLDTTIFQYRCSVKTITTRVGSAAELPLVKVVKGTVDAYRKSIIAVFFFHRLVYRVNNRLYECDMLRLPHHCSSCTPLILNFPLYNLFYSFERICFHIARHCSSRWNNREKILLLYIQFL